MSDSGLRFAMVTTFYPPFSYGGDAVFVRQLAHTLARRGHSVDVVHDIDAYLTLGGRPDRRPWDEPENVRVHGLRSRFGPLSDSARQSSNRGMERCA